MSPGQLDYDIHLPHPWQWENIYPIPLDTSPIIGYYQVRNV